jgi:hypothetical protein
MGEWDEKTRATMRDEGQGHSMIRESGQPEIERRSNEYFEDYLHRAYSCVPKGHRPVEFTYLVRDVYSGRTTKGDGLVDVWIGLGKFVLFFANGRKRVLVGVKSWSLETEPEENVDVPEREIEDM